MNAVNTNLTQVWDQTLDDFHQLISIPSVSSIPEHDGDVQRTAELILQWVHDLGCADAKIIKEGGKPAVIAHFPGPVGAPTVCLYAHHDVQPIGDISAWSSNPFEATEKAGRLYGRGTADDKCGVMSHIAALRAFEGKPPVGVTLFIEGEEEIGSPSLTAILEKYRNELAADVFVIADSSNWDIGKPALTTTLRGMAECVVTVRTLDHGVHSGEFGGIVPDALTVLSRLIATLHDERGNTAVAGLETFPAPDLEYPLDRLAHESGKLPDTWWVGDGSAVQRLWTAPAIAVLGIDTTSIANASNTLIPQASAKIGLRIPPGADSFKALDALVKHLESHAPWGADVTVSNLNAGQPSVIPTDGSAYEAATAAMQQAWGTAPVFMGMGGSIPMIAEFQKLFPTAEVICVGSCDPNSRIHGIDESLHLEDFKAYTLAEALLLEKLGVTS